MSDRVCSSCGTRIIKKHISGQKHSFDAVESCCESDLINKKNSTRPRLSKLDGRLSLF